MKPITILLLCTIIYSCTKHENCPSYFQIPVQIIPAKSEYHVGDTITIISKFHSDVLAFNLEKKEIKKFDMKGIEWKPVSVINRLDTIEHPDIANYTIISKYFNFLEDSLYNYKAIDYSSGSSGLYGEYNFKNDTFYLSIKLVTLHPGIFVHQLGSDVHSVGIGQQDFPGKCNGNGFNVWIEMNDSEDNNIDLLNESSDPHWNTWVLQKPVERFYNHGGYCFTVVE